MLPWDTEMREVLQKIWLQELNGTGDLQASLQDVTYRQSQYSKHVIIEATWHVVMRQDKVQG